MFHPRGEVSRLADGRVVHVQIAADRAHDDLAGVEADTVLHFDAVRATRLVRVALQRVLHPQCRVAGAHGVVFVGDRGAEQRHDAVAHHLIDGAFVVVRRLHHVLEHRI